MLADLAGAAGEELAELTGKLQKALDREKKAIPDAKDAQEAVNSFNHFLAHQAVRGLAIFAAAQIECGLRPFPMAAPPQHFTEEQICAMRKRFANDEARRGQVAHCFSQLVRFANELGNPTRAVQFGLNLGRAQELLGSEGGVDCWWRRFEPLLGEPKKLAALAGEYAALLGLAG